MKTGKLVLTIAGALFIAGLTMTGCSEQAQRIMVPSPEAQVEQPSDSFSGLDGAFDLTDYVESQYDFGADADLEAEEDLSNGKDQEDSNGGGSDSWKNNDPT